MSALRDPKREKFAQALFSNLAAGMKRSAAADLAAEAAGYSGSSRAANARQRAQRKDVKARIAELCQPAEAKAEGQIAATLEWATAKLVNIAGPDLGIEAIKVPDQISAVKLLAQIKGWMAPERHTVNLRHTDEMTDDELARIAAGGGPSTPAAPVDPS